jgi:hypothetical protein
MLSVRNDRRLKKELKIITEKGCVLCEAEAEETTDDVHKGMKRPKSYKSRSFAQIRGQ